MEGKARSAMSTHCLSVRQPTPDRRCLAPIEVPRSLLTVSVNHRSPSPIAAVTTTVNAAATATGCACTTSFISLLSSQYQPRTTNFTNIVSSVQSSPPTPTPHKKRLLPSSPSPNFFFKRRHRPFQTKSDLIDGRDAIFDANENEAETGSSTAGASHGTVTCSHEQQCVTEGVERDDGDVDEDGGVGVEVGSKREKRDSRQSATSTESASSDSSTPGKQGKRLARKAPSMSPGAKWRRLRNTLKAAQEMQAQKKKQALSRDDSFLRKFSTRNQRLHNNVTYPNNAEDGSYPAAGSQFAGGVLSRNPNKPQSFKPPRNLAVQHDGNFMFNWLGVVSVAVLYNLWTCILRQAFREVQQACHACWFTCDVLVDLVYLFDILVQFRTGYLNQGMMVYDSKKLARHYIQSRLLYADSVCLLPLDFLQFYLGVHPMLRFPRFLKVYRTYLFIRMLESRTAYPNLIRVANLTHILFLGAHWFAAFYYMISEAEEFKGKWSYPSPEGQYAFVSRKYLASLFWSTLTLTTIGDLPPPDNGKDYGMSNAAYVFVIVSYLIGVFVFATIVGQVGNVINNKNASRQEFERLLDGAKVYMQTHNVPSDLQKRVQRWYDYVWSRGRLNGCDINSLGLLPDKLKTELAIHVNLETLKKVTIFQECQPEFLHDLVLKMKAYIFTPGDLICRRGEVAREMFIIADGLVEIISESGTVLKQMGAGDFFGEIGILNLDGGINRRTADVRSVGYSELFVLSREDVLGALKDHPDAESIIRDYGQRRLREIEAHRRLVKPLKQLGTASHKLLNMRASASAIAPNSTFGNPGSEAGCGGGVGGVVGIAGSGAGAVSVSGTVGPARRKAYHYFNEAPDTLAFPHRHNSLFRSVLSNVRKIFHRKVDRRKNKDTDEETTTFLLRRGMSVAGGGRGKPGRLYRTGYVPVRSRASAPEPKHLTPTLYHSSPGYTAVLTEEEETACPPTPTSPALPLMGNSVLGIAKFINPDCGTATSGKELTARLDGYTVAAELNEACTSDSEKCPSRPLSTDHSESSIENQGRRRGNHLSKYPGGSASDAAHAAGNVSLEGGRKPGDMNKMVTDKAGHVRPYGPHPDRRCSEPMTYSRPRDRTLSGSYLRCSDSGLKSACCRFPSPPSKNCPRKVLEVFHGEASMANPCICVESASTVDSASSEEQLDAPDKPLLSSNLLHPEYHCQSFSRDHDDDDDDDNVDDTGFRDRSYSAPNISLRPLATCGIDRRLTCSDSSCPSAARTALPVTSLASPCPAHGIGFFQSQSTLLPTSRRPSWTPATDPLLPAPSHHGHPLLHVQHEYLTSLLVQLQDSHQQLHSRMNELETAYLSNTERLERLGVVQNDMMAILLSQVKQSRSSPA